MIQIRDLKHKAGGTKTKPHWSFSVLMRVEGAPAWDPLPVTGWRYWTDSGEVKPPQYRGGNFWHPTVRDLTQSQRDELARQVRLQLKVQGESELGPSDNRLERFDQAGADRNEHHKLRLELGEAYPELYREWAGRQAQNPEAWDLLWQQLPTGQRWPDELLDQVADLLLNGGMTTEEFDQSLAAGAFSFVDREYVLRQLRQHREEELNVGQDDDRTDAGGLDNGHRRPVSRL